MLYGTIFGIAGVYIAFEYAVPLTAFFCWVFGAGDGPISPRQNVINMAALIFFPSIFFLGIVFIGYKIGDMADKKAKASLNKQNEDRY